MLGAYLKRNLSNFYYNFFRMDNGEFWNTMDTQEMSSNDKVVIYMFKYFLRECCFEEPGQILVIRSQ
jgi:hypothetical protein